MEEHKINPLLAKTLNLLCTKVLFPTQEYHKDKLSESSYIFAPNHTNNFDGCLIWAVLAKDYEIDTFMYKEFWDNFPKIATILPIFNVYPITHNVINIKELRVEMDKLKNENHSLIIFPQGRHVDPEVMTKLFDYHVKTIPLGAFYLSARTSKPLVPIYIEP